MGGTLGSADQHHPSTPTTSSTASPLDDPLRKPWFDAKQLTLDLQALLLKLGGDLEGAALQGGLELQVITCPSSCFHR